MKWRPVVGYEGIYLVSERGDVKRVCDGSNRTPAGQLRRLQVNKKGYVTVGLTRDRRTRSFQVHRLVAHAFIGPCPPGLQVNHKDTNKKNNHYTNLEYVTCKRNIEHARINGLRADKRGLSNGGAKVDEDNVRAIRAACAAGATQSSQAQMYGLTQANVSCIVLRKTWSHV